MVPVRSMVEQHLGIDAARERARAEAARLLNSAEDEIALIESTSHGLTIAARALPLEPGDNIVTADLEFVAVPLAWRQPGTGIAPVIRVARNVDGTLPPSAFASLVDSKTKAIVVSSVQWNNGYRCDLNAIADLCHRNGALLIVDAIQQLGAFPLDVREIAADIVISGGHKWLNAPYGAGLMYIRRGIWDRLNPPVAGYMTASPPFGGWGEYFQTPAITPLQPIEFIRDARGFENGGTANYPGGIGLAASLKLINDLGQDKIEARVRSVTDHLICGLQALKLHVITPLAPECRSGIVTFGFPGDAKSDIALKEYLLDQKILVSVRYTSGIGGVRVSCHFYNTTHDVDRLLNATESWLAGHKRAS